jgi:hypothetical protein
MDNFLQNSFHNLCLEATEAVRLQKALKILLKDVLRASALDLLFQCRVKQ